MKNYRGLIQLIVLIVMMPIILYKCTFSKTHQLYKDYKHISLMEEELFHQISKDSLSTPFPLNNKNLISNGQIVEFISPICQENNVSVIKYEPELQDRESNFKLYTANLILSGNYVDLVKTLKHWEDNIQSVRISSLKYEYDEKKMKEKKVEMIVVMKQIEDD